MRFLVFSDIHGNLEAMAAVLAAAHAEFDSTLFLGDLVGYGPNPNECADLLCLQPNLTAIVGNHDVAALGEIDLDTFNPQAKVATAWTQRALADETRRFLESLGQVEELAGLTAVHGSPRDPIWEYLETLDQAPENFARFTTSLCLNGHTHVPRVFSQAPETRTMRVEPPTEGETLATDDAVRRIINAGSVGQPRDGDPRAAYGLLDTDTKKFTFRRVEYDIGVTQSKIVAAGLPEALAERLTYGF